MNYPQAVGYTSILSAIASAACLIIGAIAVDFNFEVFSNPSQALEYAANYKLAYWFMILDMLGYYLLLLPLTFYLDQQYKYRSPWTSLFTFSGLAYITIGAIGAVTLAVAWPTLMQLYLEADSESYGNIVLVFSAITLPVTKGLWNILETILSAVWLIGVGSLLFNESKTSGTVAIITGLATAADAIGNIFGISSLAELGLNIYLTGIILFAILMGFRLLKLPVKNTEMSSVGGSI